MRPTLELNPMVVEKLMKGDCAEYLCPHPFAHAVIDTFLTERSAESLTRYALSFDQSDMPQDAYERKVLTVTDENVLRFFLSRSFRSMLARLFSVSQLDFSGEYLPFLFYCPPFWSGIDPHTDNHPSRTHLSCLIYLTPDWDNSWEAGLNLCDSHNDKCRTVVRRYQPIFNRFVGFLTSATSFHSVSRSATSQQRLALSLLYNCV